MNKFLIILSLSLYLHSCHSEAQEQQPKTDLNLILSNRILVDEDSNKAEIIELYKNYLTSNPESKNQNPYWNSKEQEKYEQFNLSLPYLFQGIGAKMLPRYMDLYLMTLEPSGKNRYTLRVQYQMKGGLKNGSSIWCIHQVDAVKEKGKWVLQNFLVQKTKDWKQESLNNIDYHFAPNYSINKEKAKAASQFVDSLKSLFGLESSSSPINYYLVKNADDLGELMGFDYFFTGYTTGITKAEIGSIYTAHGEFHAHELVHLVLHQPNAKRHFLVEEGMAEFLGSKMQNPEKYKKERQLLINDFRNKADFSITSILDRKMAFEGYNYNYAFGAAVVELVYQKAGIEGLKKLLSDVTHSDEGYLNTIKSIIDYKDLEELEKLLINLNLSEN
ncbi:MAG: hypothetical protein RIC95_12600 [Vicingaceae bacterium]